jgi:GTPase involved in cell partitioning and DNA repair
MFIDSETITVESGKVGTAWCTCTAKNTDPEADLTAAMGGKGGSVILQVVPTLNTLNKFHHNEVFTAGEWKRTAVLPINRGNPRRI